MNIKAFIPSTIEFYQYRDKNDLIMVVDGNLGNMYLHFMALSSVLIVGGSMYCWIIKIGGMVRYSIKLKVIWYDWIWDIKKEKPQKLKSILVIKVSVICEKMKAYYAYLICLEAMLCWFYKSTNGFNLNFHCSVKKLSNLDLNNFLNVNY